MPGETALTNEAWAGFEARLRSYVRRRVDPLWADDLVGDILLRLVRHRDDLAAAKNPLAWIHRVAANVVTDHYRRRASERQALSAAQSEPREDSQSAEFDSDDASAEMARCLLPFIRALPERYRDALMLTEIEGLSQAAAREHLGLTHSGVKSRVQRGRAMLRQALVRCCAIELDRRGGVVGYERRSKDCNKRC